VTAVAEAVTAPLRRLGIFRITMLSLYWVALGYLWLPLGSQVIPILVLHFVGNEHKGFYTGLLEFAGTFMSVFWQPIMGTVSDRTNTRFGRRKPFIVVGTLGSVLFLSLMAVTGSYLWLFILYFLLQTSENAAQAPYQGLLPDVVPEEERSRASAFVGGGNLLGLAIGFAVVGTLMGQGRPDLALLSMAAVLLGAMLVVVLMFPDKVKGKPGQHQSPLGVIVDTFAISPRKHADFLWLMLSRLAILVSIAGLQRYVIFYFKDVFFPGSGTRLEEMASIAARDLQVVLVLFALIVSLPAAELSHRVGRKPLIVLAGILGIIGTVGVIAAPHLFMPSFMLAPVSSLFSVPDTLSQALYFGVFIGIAAGVFLSVDWAFMVDVIPPDEGGRFLGFSNIATAGSGALAGFVGGFLIDAFNARGSILGQPGGYPVTFGVYIVSFVVGILAVLKVRETRRRGGARPSAMAAGH
jgi:MFS family permease